jgi:glutamate synthase domain-containing protein 3
MKIDAKDLSYKELNEQIRASADTDITVDNAMGHRYIGNGISGKSIMINGTAGNGLGAYLNGGSIVTASNAQDATGDTMNCGSIYIHGSAGDATGYAMRGGKIYIKGDTGYRTGIHMKAYKDQVPVIIIGGLPGSFLGEYQAGGIIIVLGLNAKEAPVFHFLGTGMHGGKIFLRVEELPQNLPTQVVARRATEEDLEEIRSYVDEYASYFGVNGIFDKSFYVLTPNTKNPYKQLYTHV